MDHYTIALNLNPRNLPAQEGLQKLEQSTDTGLSGAGGGGGGGAGGGASSTAAGSAASERTYDIDMDGTSGDGGNALVFFTDMGFISVIHTRIMVLKGIWVFTSTRDRVIFGHISVLMTLI